MQRRIPHRPRVLAVVAVTLAFAGGPLRPGRPRGGAPVRVDPRRVGVATLSEVSGGRRCAPRGGQGTTQTMQAVRPPLASPSPAPTEPEPLPSRFNFWWLIGAATVIAAGLALILIYGPR